MSNSENLKEKNYYKSYKIKSNKNNFFDIEIFIEDDELIFYTSKYEGKIRIEYKKNLTYNMLKDIKFFKIAENIFEIFDLIIEFIDYSNYKQNPLIIEELTNLLIFKIEYKNIIINIEEKEKSDKEIIQDLILKISDLEEYKNDKEKKIKEIFDIIENIKNRIDKKDNEIEELKNYCNKKFEDKFDNELDKNKKLKEISDKINENYEKLEKKIDEKFLEYNKKFDEINFNKINEINQKYEKINENKNNNENSINELKKKFEEINNQLKEFKNEININLQENKEIQNQLKEDFEELNSRFDELSESNENLKNESTNINKKNVSIPLVIPNSNPMNTLLKHLIANKCITTQKVLNCMLQVDRKDFIDKNPYEDKPQYVSHNVTISAPHMHAYALEHLSPFLTEGINVLDIGSGRGYL